MVSSYLKSRCTVIRLTCTVTHTVRILYVYCTCIIKCSKNTRRDSYRRPLVPTHGGHAGRPPQQAPLRLVERLRVPRQIADGLLHAFGQVRVVEVHVDAKGARAHGDGGADSAEADEPEPQPSQAANAASWKSRLDGSAQRAFVHLAIRLCALSIHGGAVRNEPGASTRRRR